MGVEAHMLSFAFTSTGRVSVWHAGDTFFRGIGISISVRVRQAMHPWKNFRPDFSSRRTSYLGGGELCVPSHQHAYFCHDRLNRWAWRARRVRMVEERPQKRYFFGSLVCPLSCQTAAAENSCPQGLGHAVFCRSLLEVIAHC